MNGQWWSDEVILVILLFVHKAKCDVMDGIRDRDTGSGYGYSFPKIYYNGRHLIYKPVFRSGDRHTTQKPSPIPSTGSPWSESPCRPVRRPVGREYKYIGGENKCFSRELNCHLLTTSYIESKQIRSVICIEDFAIPRETQMFEVAILSYQPHHSL